MDADQFDYIIVGAGAAGSVLADRLSANPRHRVLVLESGGPDNDPLMAIPKGFYFLYGGTRHSFTYATEPTGPTATPESWQRGRVDGGSTSINGMNYDRGNRPYWDSVAARGLPGWDWDSMLPLFRGMENHELGASSTRGSGGPLDISVTREPNLLNEIAFEATSALGWKRVEDINASDGERIGFSASTIRHGVRRSAAKAFLDPARHRSNVTYLRHAHVGSIRFEGTRARGVRVRVGGQLREFGATREIILSAGGLETPQLLERSGIGRGDVLARLGITPVAENPNVGEHLIEQHQVPYQARINRDISYNKELSNFPKQMVAGAEYLVTRKGVVGTAAYDLAAFAKLLPQSDGPDTYFLLNPLSLDFSKPKLAVSKTPGFSIIGYPLHPETESSVHARSADPGQPPIVEARYLEKEWERQLTLRILETAREIASQDALRDLVVEEEMPGASVTTLDQAVAFAWAGGHLLHAVGSARMSTSEVEGVVDETLRVFGVEGLRIADSSVLPRQPGNAMAPVLGVGARAAELILAEA